MKYVYPAVFYPEETGEFSVIFPDLEGCVTQGDDLYDALWQAQDALNFWLDYLEDTGQKIPKASGLSELKLEEKRFSSLIRADTEAWRLLNAKRQTS